MKGILKGRRLNRLIKTQSETPYKGLIYAKRALVIYRNETPNATGLSLLVEEMLVKNKIKVDLIGFVTEKIKKEEVSVPGYYFKNQLNWMGFPKKEIVKDLTKPIYDVLIDLDVILESPNDFILLSAKAGLIVGITNDKPYYDLVIEKAKSDKELVKELEHYLNNITKS